MTGEAPLLPEACLSLVSTEDVFAETESGWVKAGCLLKPWGEGHLPHPRCWDAQAASQTYSMGPLRRTHEAFAKLGCLHTPV